MKNLTCQILLIIASFRFLCSNKIDTQFHNIQLYVASTALKICFYPWAPKKKIQKGGNTCLLK